MRTLLYWHSTVILCTARSVYSQDAHPKPHTQTGPNSPDDPEPDVFDPPPKNQKYYWDRAFSASGNLGLLFTGKSEFNWVVDIRVNDVDQEGWSTGNLLTYRHVLTTCRAVDLIRDKQLALRGGKDDSEIRINYCTQYLWEEYKLQRLSSKVKKYERFRTSGTRTVDAVMTHTKCQFDSFLNDLGIIQLSRGISPYAPMVGYMPLPMNLETGEVYTPDLSQMEPNRWVCHVASFGRKYRNLLAEITLDYKVKFRVYFVNWSKCREHFEFICPDDIPACTRKYSKAELKQLMCFRPRAKVGAVCDHDRGAPLVCDGKVFGFLVRGTPYDYCHDLTPFPAIVLIATVYPEYLANIAGYNFIHPDVHSEAVRFRLPPLVLTVIILYLNLL